MKANAKKLLALIMAMVMCLSLASPAFAAYNAGTNGAPGTYNNVSADTANFTASVNTAGDYTWTAASTYHIIPGAADDGSYTIYGMVNGKDYTPASNVVTEDEICVGNVTNANQPDGVTVTRTKASTYLIGEQATAAEYKVEYGVESNTVMVKAATTATKTTADVGSAWVALTDAQQIFNDGTNYQQVKGSYYVETLSNGKVNVYFKLSTYANESFDDTKPVYLVVKNIAAIGSDNEKLAAALKAATTCNDYGSTSATGFDVAITAAGVTKLANAPTVTATKYSWKAMNAVDLTLSATSGTWTVGSTNTVPTCTVAAGKTTGTFEVSIQDVSNADSSKWTYFSKADEVKTFVATALEASPVTVESVEAASGNYWTVTVSKKQGADSVTATSYSKNVVSYGTTAVLIDGSKDGWYNGSSEKGANAATIAAGTEVTGPVAVRRGDIPAGVTVNSGTLDGSYYWFPSAAALKGAFTSSTCKNGSTIPYVELKMNPVVDGKVNALVDVTANGLDEGTGSNAGKFVTVTAAPVNTLEGLTVAATNVTEGSTVGFGAGDDYDHDRLTYTVAPATSWYNTAFDTPNAAFVNKGTVDVKAASHGTLVEVVDQTPATCDKPGSKTTKTTCTVCNQVVSEKTEEIPAITDPVEKMNPNDAKKWAFDGTRTPATKHYYAKQETTTATDPATGEITVTTTYTCNFGVAHEKKTESIKKTELQYSGRWDYISLDKLTSFELWSGSTRSDLGLVKSVTVADTDVELTNVPMNRTTGTNVDQFFSFNVTGAARSTADAEGNLHYYDFKGPVDVYADAKGLPTSKYYAAHLTIKDIKVPATQCEDASCTVVVDIYEVDKSIASQGSNAINTTNLEQNLKDKKVTLVKNYTEKVSIPGRGHQFFNTMGEATELCVWCGTKKPAETEAIVPIDPANVIVENLTYTGKAAQPKVIVKDADGFALIEGTDYVVSVVTDTAVGEYTISIKGIGTYAGNKIQKTFKIVAAAKKQTLKASTTKKTFKVKNLKKKAQKFTTKLSGAKTAVTWKSNNAKVTVKGSKNKATITVKKGTKKGTYKVTATAKKTSAYKKGTVTVKVVVK